MLESLVRDLRTSSEPVDTKKALQKADEYLGELKKGTKERVVHNRTVINTGLGQHNPDTVPDSSGDLSHTVHVFIPPCATLSTRLEPGCLGSCNFQLIS